MNEDKGTLNKSNGYSMTVRYSMTINSQGQLIATVVHTAEQEKIALQIATNEIDRIRRQSYNTKSNY